MGGWFLVEVLGRERFIYPFVHLYMWVEVCEKPHNHPPPLKHEGRRVEEGVGEGYGVMTYVCWC